MLVRIKTWARNLKHDSHAIYLASRDPRVPWYAKVWRLRLRPMLSPIDLIRISFRWSAYLDDLVIVPLGVWLVVRLIPMRSWWSVAPKPYGGQRPVSKTGMIAIIVVWIVAAIYCWGGSAYVVWSRRTTGA